MHVYLIPDGASGAIGNGDLSGASRVVAQPLGSAFMEGARSAGTLSRKPSASLSHGSGGLGGAGGPLLVGGWWR